MGWVAVKELKLSYSNRGTIFTTLYMYIPVMVTQIEFSNSNPVGGGDDEALYPTSSPVGFWVQVWDLRKV